jgi:hypothetical protein
MKNNTIYRKSLGTSCNQNLSDNEYFYINRACDVYQISAMDAYIWAHIDGQRTLDQIVKLVTYLLDKNGYKNVNQSNIFESFNFFLSEKLIDHV